MPTNLTPDQAIQQLKDGNTRFVAGKSIHPNNGADRLTEISTGGQHPYATIIGCSDSRCPIENIFDAGFGEIFVIRVAGNVCATDEIGSIEYGVDHLGTPVMVVLSHSQCGAVTAVTKGDEVHGSIPKLVEPIVPAVEKAKAEHPGAPVEELIDHAIEANMWKAIEDLLTKSPDVAKAVKAGKTKVIGARFVIASGKVEWLGEHPQQAELIG
jgi:carbonic anhydrase